MRSLKSFFSGALVALALCSPVFADAAGVAKGVDPQASAVLDTVTRTLTVGGDIFLGDTITTGTKGVVQIVFADNTKLVVGPNSSLTIEDYLIRNDGSAGKLAVNMLGGTFRFITGDSPKTAYEINTPTGTIGVRGTAFDAFIEQNGIAHVLMYLGTTLLKEYGGDSEVLSGLCEMGEINDETAELVGNSNSFTGEDRKALKARFKYSLNQSSLLREFWLGKALECTHRPPTSGGPKSLLTSPSGGPVDCTPSASARSFAGSQACEGCPEGSHEEEGTCVPDDVTCSEGSHEQEGICVPDDVTCSEGYHEEEGSCVPDPLHCDEGEHEEEGQCVPDPLNCDEGEHEEAGQCVPDEEECPESSFSNARLLLPLNEPFRTDFALPGELVFVGIPVDPCDEAAGQVT